MRSGSSLNNSTEESKEFVKQLFARSSSPSSVQRSAPQSTTTSTINLNSKLSPYKRTLGKAVNNFNSSSSSSVVLPSKSSGDLKFPCPKCFTICQSLRILSYHQANQCSESTRRPIAKMPRIGIEARTCYIKPVDVETTIGHQKAIFTEKFKTNKTMTDNSSPLMSYAEEDSKMHHTSNTIVDVNSNVSAASEKMEYDEHNDEQPNETKFSPSGDNFSAIELHDNIGQAGLDYNTAVGNNSDTGNLLTNGTSPSSFASDADGEGDQDTVSNLTDSGVSSGSGTTRSDHSDGKADVAETFQASIDSPTVSNIKLMSFLIDHV